MYFPESEGLYGLGAVHNLSMTLFLGTEKQISCHFTLIKINSNCFCQAVLKLDTLTRHWELILLYRCGLLHCYSQEFGFWWSSPAVPPNYVDSRSFHCVLLSSVFLGLLTSLCRFLLLSLSFEFYCGPSNFQEPHEQICALTESSSQISVLL